MAKLSFVIVPSRVNSDGTHTIQLKITNANTTAFIRTQYKVGSEKQFQNGKVVRNPQSAAINHELSILLGQYEQQIEELPDQSAPASKIKQFLEKPFVRTDYFKEFAQMYVHRLKSNNQTSYAQNMEYTLKFAMAKWGESLKLGEFTLHHISDFEVFLRNLGQSNTTINIRMTHLKALLNAAVNEGKAEYKIFPFRGYKMPSKNIRDICISKAELAKLRDATFAGVSEKRLTIARDLFMLSFYCAGINLTDIMDAVFDKDVLTFIRKKTAHKKTGADIQVSISIQPEAREIINKYVNERGELVTGYQYSDYGQFRSFVTKSLNRIGEMLGFEKKLMFYSARKTFVQFGSELGIPLYILEYAIGQTIKEANNRPVFNYLKVMRSQADLAIRTIVDYSFEPESKDSIPLPEWARRR